MLFKTKFPKVHSWYVIAETDKLQVTMGKPKSIVKKTRSSSYWLENIYTKKYVYQHKMTLSARIKIATKHITCSSTRYY